MKDFPLLISAALIYWGYKSDHIAIAIIFAFLLEAHRIIKLKWDFTEKDFNYISMLSTISTAGYIIYYVNSSREAGVISSILQFLPIILFPLNFFYLYSTTHYVNAKRLFLLFVTNKYSITHPYVKYFRPDYLYLSAILVGGSIKAEMTSFLIVFILIIPVFIKFRSKNHSLSRFIVSITGVLFVAVFFQFSIYNSFLLIKDVLTDMYIDKFMNYHERSAQIGNIGNLKGNFRIDIRVDTFRKRSIGILLRDRVYNNYFDGRWSEISAGKIELDNNLPDYRKFPVDSLKIIFFSNSKYDYLKMPFGTFDFAGIELNKISLNSLGNISYKYSQYLIDYKTYVRTDSIRYLFNDPDENDLKFNLKDTLYTDQIIDSLKIKGLEAGKVFSILRNYFIKNYRYSLDYSESKNSDKLKNFNMTKAGHCELFATLSSLIFRRLGYPTRYVTGYYLTEYNEFDESFVGRKKDRHAWIYVWDNNSKWLELDTTPPDISLNRTKPSFFNKIYDFFSYAYYKAFLFKKENNDLFQNILKYSLIPLGLFLLFRILKDVKLQNKNDFDELKNPYKEISELLILEDKLKALEPKKTETVGIWFDGIKNRISNGAYLNVIKSLYYRKRYGNIDLDVKEKKEFLNALEKIKEDQDQ